MAKYECQFLDSILRICPHKRVHAPSPRLASPRQDKPGLGVAVIGDLAQQHQKFVQLDTFFAWHMTTCQVCKKAHPASNNSGSGTVRSEVAA